MPAPQNKQTIFAISDAGYATMALTMFDSVARFYPDADFYFFIIGTGDVTTLNGNVHVVYIADVMDALDLRQRLTYYLQIELVCSVRPHCFEYLFAKGYERALYIDPDVFVFRRMTEIDELLDGDCNGVITPHALSSISDGELDGGDNVFLKCGIFNMGFLALKNTVETRRMVAWWKEKLKWKCTVDWPNGYFVDQKWLEFLPVYFEDFHILRSPAYNLAPWNAEHYNIISDDRDNFYFNDLKSPIAFIHFSGIKRMELHFKFMKKAHRFYINELQKRKFQKLPFSNYPVRFRDADLPFDKVCTFLYKDYVKKTKDEKSDPLLNHWFYDYACSTDEETGFPVYIRKLYEIMPDIFVNYLTTGLATNWDNIIYLVQNHFNYDAVASLDTMIRLRNAGSPPNFTVGKDSVGDNSNGAANSYYAAAQTLEGEPNEDATDSDSEITYLSDRIEIKRGHVTICIPKLDYSGSIPSDAKLSGRKYTELWVPSVSSKEKIRRERGIRNVTPIMHPIEIPNFKLSETGLPHDKFIVLMLHDFNHDLASQDPIASFHAFDEAFADKDNVLLICYLVNANGRERETLLSAAKSLGDIRFVDGTENSNEYYSYLYRSNCFISLHQETAFGVPIAEAMAMGKDVIATASGGNTHYMNSDNSFLVGTDSAMGVITQAAKYLVEVYKHISVRDLKGKKASLHIRKHLSPHVIGYAMQKRLEQLSGISPVRSKTLGFKVRREFRRVANQITGKKAQPPSVIQQFVKAGPEQTAAVMKVLLKNVIRPDVME